MFDARLYLPKDWCNDPALCQQTGIPEGADWYYGNYAEFASAIDQLGYLYMLDIDSDQSVYLERPELILPERKRTRGANAG